MQIMIEKNILHIFNQDGVVYTLDLSTVTSHHELLEVVHFLCSRRWISVGLIQRFIRAVYIAKPWEQLSHPEPESNPVG